MQLHEHPTEHLRKGDGRPAQGRWEEDAGEEGGTTGKKEATLPPPLLQPSVPSQPSFVSAQPAGRGFALHELFSAENRFVQSL
jgi:hypothetical protein